MVHRHESNEDGFGLIEIVVAIFILGLIAVALLPMILQSMKLSAEQATVATASSTLTSLIETARVAPSCDSLDTAAAASGSIADGRGGSFYTKGSVGSCADTSTDAQLVSLTLKATSAADGGGRILSTRSVQILIPATAAS